MTLSLYRLNLLKKDQSIIHNIKYNKMKKLSLLLMMLIAISAFSQQEGQYNRGDRSDMSAEEMATLQTERLTLHLNLNEAQQQEVKKLHLESATERKAMMAERKKMNAEDKVKLRETRNERMNERMEMQKAHSEKMKQILDEEQFKKWEDFQSKMQRSPNRNKGNRN